MKTIQERLQAINETIENSKKNYLSCKDNQWIINHNGKKFMPVEREFINGPVNGKDSSNHVISSERAYVEAKAIYRDYDLNQNFTEDATVSQRAIGDDDEGFKVGNNIRGGIY